MREQRLVFGEVARDYDDLRAGYPDALAEAVFRYLGRVPEHILEVGAGTGKATAAFAGRGAPITCVEPDPAMAAVLRDRCAGTPEVQVSVGAFEAYAPPPGGVPLIICAQAWHWVAPEVRLAKAYACLCPGGVLALFGHEYAFVDPVLEAALREAYATHEPQLLDAGGHGRPPAPSAHWMTGELTGSPLFTDVTATHFESVAPYPTQRYLSLLTTFSPHRMLPPRRRTALLGAIAEVVDAHGGVVEQLLHTVLVMGRRRG